MSKKLIAVLLGIILCLCLAFSACGENPQTPDNTPSDDELYEENNNFDEITEMYIAVNGNKLKVTLEQNSSVDALVELLKQGDITFTASKNGNFEMVGNIGYTLPRNDAPLTGEAGDVILYAGNQLCLFFDSYFWSAYTRIGKINGYSASELSTLLGAEQGTVQVTMSL